jgi:hypothetical protein
MLTTIKTERSDVTTETPNIYAGVNRAKKHPKIEVLPSEMRHDYGFEDAPLVHPWLIHHINLRITHVHPTVEVVQNTLYRYSETINRLQEADDTFGSVFVDVKLDDEDYSPMMENRESRELTQMLIIPLICKSLST